MSAGASGSSYYMVKTDAPVGGKIAKFFHTLMDEGEALAPLVSQGDFTLCAKRSDERVKELYQRAKDLGAVDDSGPRVLGVMLMCGPGYSMLHDLDVDQARKDRLFFSLLNARIVLAVLRGALLLKGLEYPDGLDRVQINPPIDSFRSCLQDALDSPGWNQTFSSIIDLVAARVRERAQRQARFQEWIAAREKAGGSPTPQATCLKPRLPSSARCSLRYSVILAAGDSPWLIAAITSASTRREVVRAFARCVTPPIPR